jgi:hypothetical protein
VFIGSGDWDTSEDDEEDRHREDVDSHVAAGERLRVRRWRERIGGTEGLRGNSRQVSDDTK